MRGKVSEQNNCELERNNCRHCLEFGFTGLLRLSHKHVPRELDNNNDKSNRTNGNETNDNDDNDNHTSNIFIIFIIIVGMNNCFHRCNALS